MYKSPTDMGVNRVGFGIVDDDIVQEASRQEIISRYFKTGCEYKKGYVDLETFQRAKLIMEELGLKPEDRKVVVPARERSEKLKEERSTNDLCPSVAIELADGTMITGKGSETMDAAAAALLNAVKQLAKIGEDIHLISPGILDPINALKSNTLNEKSTSLNCEEVLIALSISMATNPMAQIAMDKLSLLNGCQAHSTTILNTNDEQTFRKLGIEVTSDSKYASGSLYYL